MLCLELMTELQPYSDIALDVTVAIALSKFQLPPRPGHPVISRGLTDNLWALMMQCWTKRPESRPSMTSIKADIKRLRGIVGSSPNPRTDSTLLLSSDIVCLPETASLASSPAHIQAELIAESFPEPAAPKGSRSRPSTAGSGSSEYKDRRSFGLFSALKRHSRSSSSQQPSPPNSFLDIPHSPSLISPISSPILPEIKYIGEDSDESAFGDFHSAQMEVLPAFSQRRTTHDYTVPRIHGGSVQERETSRGSNLQNPNLSSSLPRHSEFQQPMSALEDKPPSVLSMGSSSPSTSFSTVESIASHEPPPVLRAKDGSIEAATLEGLIDQLIADFSCE